MSVRDVVSQTGWLSKLPKEFREDWLDACELRAMSVGEILHAIDDPPGGIYGVAAGYVDVLVASGPFPAFLSFIARPGWWTGEAAAATGTHRRSELRARTALQVFYLPPNSLRGLQEDHPHLWRYLGQMTVTHLDNAMMLAATLMRGDPRSKIVATLIRLSGHLSLVDAETSIPCSQQELGEMAGLSRNSVGPILQRLEREGLISRRTYAVTVYNPVRLGRSLYS